MSTLAVPLSILKTEVLTLKRNDLKRILLLILVCFHTALFAQTWQWAERAGGVHQSSFSDLGQDLVVDKDGNVIVVGHFTDTAHFDTVSLIGVANTNSFVAKYDSSGTLLWVNMLEGYGTLAKTVAVDAFGDIYMAGVFGDTLTIGQDTTLVGNPSFSNNEIYFVKFDALGNYQWAQQSHSSQLAFNFPISLAVDTANFVYFCGSYRDTVTFDTITLAGSGTPYLFLAKYNLHGEVQWVEEVKGDATKFVSDLALGDDGNVYLTGSYVLGDLITQGQTFSNPGGFDNGFILKYNAQGTFQWFKNLGGSSAVSSLRVAVGVDHQVYATGFFYDTLIIDSQSFPQTGSGIHDLFLAKFDSSGAHQWVRTSVSSNLTVPQDLTSDDFGNVYITGLYDDTVHFGSVTLPSNGVFSKGFIASYAANGNVNWATGFGSTVPSHTNPNAIAVDKLGQPHVTGWYDNTTYFDSITLHAIGPNGSGSDIFTAKYGRPAQLLIGGDSVNVCGDSVQLTAYGGSSFLWLHNGDTSASVWVSPTTPTTYQVAAVDFYGNVDTTVFHIAAILPIINQLPGLSICPGDSALIFGQYRYVSGMYSDMLTSTLGCDSLVFVDLTVHNTDSITDVVTACDFYTWMDGNTYTASNNTAIHTLSNALGCDSLVFLDLTINYADTTSDVVTACDSYTWMDGLTYTTSNSTATFNLQNAAGCDSLILLDLTVLSSTSSIDTVVACNSYTWINGVTYTLSNTVASHTLTNAVGCDSIVYLDLTIIYSSSGTDVITACDTYTWMDGITYFTSNNTATHTLSNSVGCDSLVYLDLTINYSDSTLDVVTACDAYTWMDGVTYTTSNTSATYTLQNSAGCDSVISLDLTILSSSSFVDTVVACNNYTWINGVTYTSSNTVATDTLTNAVGCDSIVYLNLTINHSSSATDTITACNFYTWIDGITYTADNTTATYTLLNSSGCDSLLTLDLTINDVNDSVTVNGTTLTSGQADARYQWLLCNTDNEFTLLPNDTNQSFTARQNGSYAVQIIKNGCIDTSGCTAINAVSIPGIQRFQEVSVFPNPTSGTITIDLGANATAQVRILNAIGQVVRQTSYISPTNNAVYIDGAAGIYFVEVSLAGAAKRFRVIKK